MRINKSALTTQGGKQFMKKYESLAQNETRTDFKRVDPGMIRLKEHLNTEMNVYKNHDRRLNPDIAPFLNSVNYMDINTITNMNDKSQRMRSFVQR